jgi:hypothetical protein
MGQLWGDYEAIMGQFMEDNPEIGLPRGFIESENIKVIFYLFTVLVNKVTSEQVFR